VEPPVMSSDPGLAAVRQRRLSLRASMNGLEQALAAPAVGRMPLWNDGVRTAVTALQECMRGHIEATEGPDGFHSDIVSAAPRLAHAVEVSAREHAAIMKQVADLIAASDRANDVADAELIRESGTRLLGLLSRHRQRGADLIYAAYQSDLGGED
jgi:hypothetical protein